MGSGVRGTSDQVGGLGQSKVKWGCGERSHSGWWIHLPLGTLSSGQGDAACPPVGQVDTHPINLLSLSCDPDDGEEHKSVQLLATEIRNVGTSGQLGPKKSNLHQVLLLGFI